MKNLACYVLLAVLGACLLTAACGGGGGGSSAPAPFKVAFMPDVHFHDVYANFDEGNAKSFKGLEIPSGPAQGKFATIRTMSANLESTRLFNENYFAFTAALDDAVAKGVKYIAMPGDFSDDGQPVHIRGLVKIMDEYSSKHGIQFFVLPGNHDPISVLDSPSGKGDYLGIDGSGKYNNQKIYSEGADNCSLGTDNGPYTNNGTICTEEVVHQGYAGITKPMEGHGFMPKPEYVYYETPYSTYSYEDYSFDTALAEAAWANRVFDIAGDGAHSGVVREVPDTSYLVEPVEGLWLLAIDSDVFFADGNGENDFGDPGNQGWNKMVEKKPHVVAWIADVVARANAQGKQLVAFSHHPMIEFFDGQIDDIAGFLGNKMQITRAPSEATSKTLAETGLRLHVGGHMHFNDTGYRNAGGSLFNIQAPSMAAYVPAYKVVTLLNADEVELETVALKEVPGFNELFPLYELEHNDGKTWKRDTQWDKTILQSKNYADFSYHYMNELVRIRLLSDDWYADMKELALTDKLTGADMLVLSQLDSAVKLEGVEDTQFETDYLSDAFFDSMSGNAGSPDSNITSDLATAKTKAEQVAIANGMTLVDFEDWTILDMATDFARLYTSGDLAFGDIGKELGTNVKDETRAQEYVVLAKALAATNSAMAINTGTVAKTTELDDYFQARFKPLTAIMLGFTEGIPSAHVRLNLATGEVTDLSGIVSPFVADK